VPEPRVGPAHRLDTGAARSVPVLLVGNGYRAGECYIVASISWCLVACRLIRDLYRQDPVGSAECDTDRQTCCRATSASEEQEYGKSPVIDSSASASRRSFACRSACASLPVVRAAAPIVTDNER